MYKKILLYFLIGGLIMATLPADRTKLSLAQANQVPSAVASAKRNIDTLTEAYDTIDLLNQKVEDHIAATPLPHADGSVTRSKIANGAINESKIEDNAVVPSKIPDQSLTAEKFVPGALTNETQNALRITALEEQFDEHLADDAYHGFMRRQALINGNFDVWQRGTSKVNTVGFWDFIADRWLTAIATGGGSLPNLVTSRERAVDGELDGVRYYFRVTSDGAGSGLVDGARHTILQRIENGVRYLAGEGRKITLSFYARSSIPGKRLGVNIHQYYGIGGSPQENIFGTNFELTTEWKRYSHTFTTNTLNGKTIMDDDHLEVQIWPMWGDNYKERFFTDTNEDYRGAGTVDIAQVLVNAGDVALPYPIRSYAEELALCQRYYEKSYDINDVPGTTTLNGMESIHSPDAWRLAVNGVKFKVRKYSTPTVTLYNTQNGTQGESSEYNTGGVFVQNVSINSSSPSETGYIVTAASGGFTAGNTQRFHWTAESEIGHS